MLDFDNGVLFRARNGESEAFDCPLSLQSARRVALMLTRRWNDDVEVVPYDRDGAQLDQPAFVQVGTARRHRRIEQATAVG